MKNIKRLFLGISALGCLSLTSCISRFLPSISGSSNNSSYTTSDTSTSTVDDSTHVTGVYLNYNTYSLPKGKTVTLRASIEPEDATNQNISWKSSNTEVATVSNGLVTGVKAGTATITVTTADGGYTDTCEVTVTDEPDDDYVPDDTDTTIYSITEDTLDQGEYDASADEYTFALTGNYKQVYVNAPDKTIILELSGVTIQNNENSPIYVLDCDTIEISAKKKTVNYVTDTRSIYTEDDSSQGKGAIYVSNGDLKLKGAGTLNIAGGYYNGIHGKDDVKIQKETLNITAVHHGIKGNDSITISSGTINISCGGDGMHTENTDISSKGNQRGNITINGGTIKVDSWGDAVAASYNAVFEELEGEEISFDAKTNQYSSYDGEKVETSDSSFYIKMNNRTYGTGNYTYAAYINETWYPATYKGSQSSSQGGPGGGGPGGWGPGGGSSTYYFYEIEKPSNATTFKLYRFAGKVTTYSTTSYDAVSENKAFNANADTAEISVSSGKITISNWSNYESNGTSAKGVKAENEVNVKSGTLVIKAYDDGLHTNSDATFDNGLTPTGDINISGGNITVTSADDGLHADCTLNITGGTINVLSSYEGLEGNTITVSGGTIYAYATDDGMNASSGAKTPSITISGGYLDIEVPSNGDTDGIDSNGSFTLKGGVVIVKGTGNASGTSMGAAAVDADGTISLQGGTIICFGGFEKTPSTSLIKTLCSSNTVSAGEHTVTFSSAAYTTTLKSSTRGCIVYSELGSATLS